MSTESALPTEEDDWAEQVLAMVRDRLAKYIPMVGCAPMFYEEAITNLAQYMYWMGSRRAPMPENPKEEYAKYETYLRNVIHQNKGLRCSIQDLAARS